MKRVHIIGRKNSGKTTLVEDLIRHFSQSGLRVGAVKHTHHRHELDTPGKDSFRHRHAGAAPVAVLAPTMTAVFTPLVGEHDSDDRYEALAAAFADCDLVLVEGDSQTSGRKIEVWRAVVGSPPIAFADPGVLALVTDDDPLAMATSVAEPFSNWRAIPRWARSDVGSVAARLLELLKSP